MKAPLGLFTLASLLPLARIVEPRLKAWCPSRQHQIAHHLRPFGPAYIVSRGTAFCKRKAASPASMPRLRAWSLSKWCSRPHVLLHLVLLLTTPSSWCSWSPSQGQRQHVSRTVTGLATALHVPDSVIETKTPKAGERYNYGQVLYLTSFFYEAQRSGRLPSDNRVPWRGNSALDDGRDVGKDLTGGWYDAGDHVKFVFPMSYTVTVLAWGLHEYWDAYQDVKEVDRMLGTLRWGLDFLLKAHTSANELYYQVGDGGLDHAYWGPPESMTMHRPSYKINATQPGTDIAGEAAAAMAAGSMVFKDKDPVYATKLLLHARQLMDFADKYRGLGSTAYYISNSYLDELAWGATWLYQATGERTYLQKAELYYQALPNRGPKLDDASFCWDEKRRAVEVLLWQITGRDAYRNSFQDHMAYWFSLPQTPEGGLSFYSEWGSLRFAANTAFLAFVAADNDIMKDELRQWARKQVDFILGDCCGGPSPHSGLGSFSYIVGMGDNFPRAPHHRSSSCDGPGHCDCTELPHPHVLYGAMVGGPIADGSYSDRCPDYIHNEVATDYNAGITGAAAALRHLTLTKQLPPYDN